MKLTGLIERQISGFLRKPASLRYAARVIVISTAIVVVGSGLLIWLLDRSEFSTPWLGMWWALQTVTTVGYGDIVPKRLPGRIVGVAVMLWGIAFVAILVAAITSTFITRAARERGLSAAASPHEEALNERIDDIM